jgi:hypothetical protein
MLRRILLGLTEGLVLGLAFGVASARGLGLGSPGSIVALLLGACAGFGIGLVAGRPIWARNAKTEALLKAAAGALAGVGLSFVLRRWLNVHVDLRAFSLGAGSAGQLSAVTLPITTTLLALFFELDDDGAHAAGKPLEGGSEKPRVASEASDSSSLDDSEWLDDEAEHKREKR